MTVLFGKSSYEAQILVIYIIKRRFA